MTGCGCLVLIAGVVALLVVFVRGSFDAGEPIDTAVMLAVAVVLSIQVWRGKWSTHQLVRTRGA